MFYLVVTSKSKNRFDKELNFTFQDTDLISAVGTDSLVAAFVHINSIRDSNKDENVEYNFSLLKVEGEIQLEEKSIKVEVTKKIIVEKETPEKSWRDDSSMF